MAKILIKNGRVWDGTQFFEADILTNGDKIEKIEQHITDDALRVYDASGKIVSAGLVDLHTHLRLLPNDKYGIQAEMSCFPFGVTAAADAGRTFGSLEVLNSFMLKNVVFASASVSDDCVDIQKIEETIERFGDKVVGVKVYFDTTISKVSDISSLQQVCAFAKKRGLRVMVHCSHSPTKMSEILNTLNPGDILTHAYHGGENNAADDFDAMLAAKARGVIIDAGFAGHIHTDFSVFEKAIEKGALPDTISTDITKFSAYVRGGRYGMTMCMSLARYMGMTEESIFKAVTSSPAKAIGKADEWGCLKVGGNADIVVLEETDEPFSLTDAAGNHVESERGYRCVLTLSDGQIIYKH